MLSALKNKTLNLIIPVLIFCFIFYSGCTSASETKTVDSDELNENIDEIQKVYNFKLNDGKIYSYKNGNIFINKWDKSNPLLIYIPFNILKDSAEINSNEQKETEFSLKFIKSAKVKLKAGGEYATVWNVLGGIAIMGLVILFLFINTNRK